MGAALSSLVLCAGCEEEKAKAEAGPEISPAKEEVLRATADKPELKSVAPVARPAVVPENLKVSPALAEIIKLAQAGVSEEVMLSYITNSSGVYRIGADEILYLNDLGVSTPVITALIQRDAAPESAARKPDRKSVV